MILLITVKQLLILHGYAGIPICLGLLLLSGILGVILQICLLIQKRKDKKEANKND